MKRKRREHQELAHGFPALGDYTPVMQDAVFRKIGSGLPLAPADLTVATVLGGAYDAELVRVSGRLLKHQTYGGEHVLVLQSGAVTFQAEIPDGAAEQSLADLRDGALLRLTGICSVQVDENRARGLSTFSSAPRTMLWCSASLLVDPSQHADRARADGRHCAGRVGLGRGPESHGAKETETIRATLESTADGILVVDENNKVLAYDKKFVEMWGLPESALAAREGPEALEHVLGQLKEPEAFGAKVRELNAHPDAASDEVIAAQDGRAFELHSEPQRMGGRNTGRVWGFKDITARVQEEGERRVTYEIMHGINTTSNLEELLRIVHQSLRTVIYAENCFVALYDHKTGLFHFPLFTDRYDTAPPPARLEKSCTAYVFRTGQPMLIPEDVFARLAEQGEVELVGSPSPSD